MSTTERINIELAALQKELGQLKSYTEDIGRARDASNKVLQASERFVSAFQSHISSLVESMEKGSSDFQQTCARSSDQLQKASVRFDADIDRSQKLLDVLGKQLDAAAGKVEQMTGEIRQMDIPGRFDAVIQDVQSAEANLSGSLHRLEEKHALLMSQTRRSFLISVILGTAAVGLLLFLVLR